jgi:ubiquinone/menaquinone biosynthesis C-methylase UbiE
MQQAFDLIAEDYDRWYDRPEGRAVFSAELKCLRSVCNRFAGAWLEVGVGTGRFASSLKIKTGIDPSLSMLQIARERGIIAVRARAENLPFPDESFDGILLALTLCFIEDHPKALRECFRVLRPGGSLLAGIIPADGAWGRVYNRKKEAGHPVYAAANFSRIPEILSLFERTGLTVSKAASTLYWSPENSPEPDPRIKQEVDPGAGFLALLCTKNA